MIDTDCIGTCSYKFNIRSPLRRLPFFGGRDANSVSPTKHLISIILGCALIRIKNNCKLTHVKTRTHNHHFKGIHNAFKTYIDHVEELFPTAN